MPIASTLEPLTDSQVAAYRRLPGDFGTMLQVCFNDGWNGCHAHMKEEIVKLDARVAELEAALNRKRILSIMSDPKPPFSMSPDEIWDELSQHQLTDPLIRAVWIARLQLGLDREHTALALALALLQQLHATRAEFEEWIKATPRPITVNPGPEFLRSLMARKG